MPTKGEHVLVDTSAALALVQRENPFHRAAVDRLLSCRRGLSGHAAVELLSVLTRLPSPHRLSPTAALHLEDTNFPESRFLSATDTKRVLKEMAEGGMFRGSRQPLYPRTGGNLCQRRSGILFEGGGGGEPQVKA